MAGSAVSSTVTLPSRSLLQINQSVEESVGKSEFIFGEMHCFDIEIFERGREGNREGARG